MLSLDANDKVRELFSWMDHEVLKERLNKIFKSRNLSVASAERLAGLGAGSIRNFLVGKTKSPTLETLSALTTILDCSLPELLGWEEEKNIPSGNHPSNLSLYSQTVDVIKQVVHDNNLTLTDKELFKAMKEIYLYFQQKKDGMLDREFAEWYMKNVLKK